MVRYRYTIEGTSSHNTWEHSGVIEALPGLFPAVAMDAMRETFMALTKGKAVFGKPGVGCDGPYTATRLEIRLLPEH